MAKRKVETGRTADTVSANVARIRRGQGLTLRDVAERLSETDRPLSHNSISEIERGARRCDVDDLTALAHALGVSPLTLLMPSATEHELVKAAGTPEITALEMWQWMRTDLPFGRPDAMANLEFQWRSKPSWAGAEVIPRTVDEPLSPEYIEQVADAVRRKQDHGDD